MAKVKRFPTPTSELLDFIEEIQEKVNSYIMVVKTKDNEVLIFSDLQNYFETLGMLEAAKNTVHVLFEE